jgi:hypothetical protein
MSRGSVVYYQHDPARLNVELIGCFDDYSAQKLIDLLKRSAKTTSIVFVRTDQIADIHPSGLAAFQDGLSILKDFCYQLVFIGKEANRLAPGWTRCF